MGFRLSCIIVIINGARELIGNPSPAACSSVHINVTSNIPHLRCMPQAPEPELDLPDDMDLDANEPGGEAAAADDSGSDEGGADDNAPAADAPPQRFPEQPVRAEGEPEGPGRKEGDQGPNPEGMEEDAEGDEAAGEGGAAGEPDAQIADEGEGEGGDGEGDAGMPDAGGADDAEPGDEAAAAAAAAAAQAEAAAAEEGGNAKELAPAAAHGGEATGSQEQLPEAGPQGTAAAAAVRCAGSYVSWRYKRFFIEDVTCIRMTQRETEDVSAWQGRHSGSVVTEGSACPWRLLRAWLWRNSDTSLEMSCTSA